jgi:hypothetical protein
MNVLAAQAQVAIETKHVHGCAGGLHNDKQSFSWCDLRERYNWIILAVLVLAGWIAAKFY